MSEKELNKSATTTRKTQSKPSRRKFLTSSGKVVVGAALTASSYSRVSGANDRIRLGVVGCGNMGTQHIVHFTENEGAFAKANNAEITAVCDIYEPRKERATQLSSSPIFHDYRDLIASGLVDGLIIATPEHWHYRQALDAIHAGLDIYLQKPMTRTFEEAKSLYQEVTKLRCVFQLGSQYMQTPTWRRARKLFKEGHIGKMTMCQTSYCRNSKEGEWNNPMDPDVEPGKNLDWKTYLGPLPYMDYDPEYYFHWRKYRAFSSGIISDLLPHKIHTLSYVIGPQFPRKVTAVGGIYVHPDRDVADTVAITVQFEDFTMIVAGSTCNEVGLEDLIRGHYGNLYIGGNSIRLTPERIYADEFDPIEERPEPALTNSHMIHVEEWLKSMRSRKQPTWGVEPTYKVMTTIAMAEQAYLEGRAVEFDAQTQQVI